VLIDLEIYQEVVAPQPSGTIRLASGSSPPAWLGNVGHVVEQRPALAGQRRRQQVKDPWSQPRRCVNETLGNDSKVIRQTGA
jgi:hypothetical protein